MKTVYRSKISLRLLGIVIFTMMIVPLAFYHHVDDWKPFLIVSLAFLILFLVACIRTKYEVTGSQLIVHHPFIFKEVIDIGKIKSIEHSHTLISAPAASLDRLRISYNKYDEVIISPKRSEEFIQQLKGINPQIAVKEDQ